MKNFIEIRIITLILIVFAGLQSIAQIKSFPVNSTEIDPSSDGFYYGLPKHTIRVDVTVKKVEKFKGKYSDYATRLLGITDYITKDATTYEIRDVSINLIAELDSANIYYAQLPAKFDDDRTFMLNMLENGLIANVSVFDKEQAQRHNPDKTPFIELLKPVLIEKVDTIIRRVSIDTTVIEEKVLKRNISEKSNEQQAKEIADLIYRIEESKYNLITGYQEVNYSQESIRYMIEKLSKLESEYIAFFKGSIQVSEITQTYYYTPNSNEENSQSVLFRFSTSDGLINSNRTTGDPITISILRENKFAAAMQLESKRFAVKKKDKGVYYRIPESVQIQVKSVNNTLEVKKAYISQMGIMSFLPSKYLSNVSFNENGFIKSLTLQD